MYVLQTLSFCVIVSSITNNVYCDVDDAVFKEVFITWRSENKSDLKYINNEETTRNLRDVVPKNISSWGLFIVETLCFIEIPLLKKDSITDIKNLTSINLQVCGICEIEPGALRNLPQLKNLSISFNKLTEINGDTFANLSITYLDLDYNNISILQPGAFGQLPNLKVLSLEGNILRRFPNNLFDEVSNIERLILSRNRLSHIEHKAFKDLLHLLDLELGFNQLTKLDCSIFNIRKLKKLNLMQNSISVLPSGCFENLPQLLQLSLRSNKLIEISGGLFNYSKIETLDLSMNEISVIAFNAFDSPTLRFLEVDDNNLTVWDSRWLRSTPKLVKLSAWENQIEELPDEAVSYCSYISFADNGIKTISRNAFRNLKVINHLDLENNEIENWDVDLLSNITVHYVSLYNNKLQCIDGDLEKVFEGVEQVVLYKNPWRPDCQAKVEEFNLTHRSDTIYSNFFSNKLL